MIIVMVALMGMFAVIMESAAVIRKQLQEEHDQSKDYETLLYLWKKMKNALGIYDDSDHIRPGHGDQDSSDGNDDE